MIVERAGKRCSQSPPIPPTGFNSLEVTYVSGNPFIITGFGTASVLSAPVSFNVPVELVDADGDAAAAALRVALLPPGAGTRSRRQ